MKKLILLLCLVPVVLLAGPTKSATVLAGSDFQAPTDIAGTQIVSEILEQVKKAGVKSVDGVLYCGDYTVALNNRASESEAGIAALTGTLLNAGLGIKQDKIVFVQGNHDPVGTKGISPSGGNDPADGKYGVFVINEDDFMWMQGRTPSNGNQDVADDEDTIKRTASALETYLADKEKKRFRAPIFVVSHLPLHYSMRTFNDGDGRFAKYIFDVLNRFASRGLKLVFLFGHNHSHGWDNYIGASEIYLVRGDKIFISLPTDNKKCSREKLEFTYMNAGYTGYFTTDDSADGAVKTLSMTVFEISPNGDFSVKRYSQKGRTSLKARGVPNTRKNNQETTQKLYAPDTRIREK